MNFSLGILDVTDVMMQFRVLYSSHFVMKNVLRSEELFCNT